MLCLALSCAALLAIPTRAAPSSADCGIVAAPTDATVEPAACVTFGQRFTIRSNKFTPGQIVSVLIRGSQGLVGGADRTARVGGDGALVVDVDTTNFGRASIPAGDYVFVAKDITGKHTPAQAPFRVVGAATPTPPPAPTTEASTTAQPPATTPQPAVPTSSTGPRAPPPGIPIPLGDCRKNEPLPAEGAQAWVTDPNPPASAATTLCVRLIVDQKIVRGATVRGTVSSPVGSAEIPTGQTRTDGVALIAFRLANANPGQTVRIDVTATNGGQTYRASAIFTPR
jgi:hypothetical protein